MLTPAEADALRALLRLFKPDLVMTGKAGGVDACAEEIANDEGFRVTVHAANWRQEGKSAGPRRNQRMAEIAGPQGICVAFRGARGTADMMKRAKASGMNVIDLRRQYPLTPEPDGG